MKLMKTERGSRCTRYEIQIRFKRFRREVRKVSRDERILTESDFTGTTVDVSYEDGKIIFMVREVRISRKSALQRLYSYQYRRNNPERSKQSSKTYAKKIRDQAKLYQKSIEDDN